MASERLKPPTVSIRALPARKPATGRRNCPERRQGTISVRKPGEPTTRSSVDSHSKYGWRRAYLAETLANTQAGPGLRAEAAAELAEAKDRLARGLISKVEMQAQSELAQARIPGEIAAAQQEEAIGYGQTPDAGLAGTRIDSARRVVAAEHRAALRAKANGNEAEAQQHEAAEARAQADVPRETSAAIESQFATRRSLLGSAETETSFGLQQARFSGAGGEDVATFQQDQVREANERVRLANDTLAMYQKAGFAPDSSVIAEKTAAVQAAQGGLLRARQQLSDVTIPTELRERLSQTQFAANVMQSSIGGYGPLRGILQERMSELQEQGGFLNESLRLHGDEMGAEGRLAVRDKLRGVAQEQLQTFNQLSFGWENRLVSQMFGSSQSYNLEGRGFALHDAVGAGVRDPHFGSTGRSSLPMFLDMAAGLIDVPHQAGLRGPLPGRKPGVMGFGDLTEEAAGRGGVSGAGMPIVIPITVNFNTWAAASSVKPCR